MATQKPNFDQDPAVESPRSWIEWTVEKISALAWITISAAILIYGDGKKSFWKAAIVSEKINRLFLSLGFVGMSSNIYLYYFITESKPFPLFRKQRRN